MDLDDDELRATRRINGSDKNVACVEENIEGLKRLFYANALTQHGKRKLIDYYEQLIKELEEKLNETLNANLALVQGNANSIPVSLVEEKIEELNKAYEDSKDENGESEYYYPDYTISVLQELLEKRKYE